MNLPPSGHDPVLLREVIELLRPSPGQTIVDCTLGRAGHASAIAEHLGSAGTLIGLDADPRNLAFAKAQLESAPCRVRLFHANFSELALVMRACEIAQAQGLLADLGLSTNQLFDADYGLSFASDGPLDMRIDPRDARTAAHYVNTMREEDLADVLYNLAQERYSRRIARKIAEARRISPINSTGRLADLVRSVLPRRHDDKIDPATRTFLALRMLVNREIENTESLLKQIPAQLTVGGRAAIISFQSTEDRLVKQAFRMAEQNEILKVLTKKPLVPTDEELDKNPRSRSAKLRGAERIR